MDAQVSHRYRSFAPWAARTSPLYAEWSAAIASDSELTDRIGALGFREGQPNLVFAAARWAGAPLGPYPSWRAWVLDHWAAIGEIAATRSTQTNEVGRCATLLPVLSGIDGPVALLETGTAAGLCLYPDRYGYDYRAPGGMRSLGPGPETASVHLPCLIDRDDAVPTRLPAVVWRAGIDLNPIDAGDDDARAWLETLIWPGPDHDGRVQRLRSAASIVAEDAPTIVRGDILDKLDQVAAEAPRDATLVIFHSAVLMYFTADECERFADLIASLARRLPQRVVWLANETAGVVAPSDGGLPPSTDLAGSFVQTVDGVPVALAGQHGAVYEVGAFRG